MADRSRGFRAGDESRSTNGSGKGSRPLRLSRRGAQDLPARSRPKDQIPWQRRPRRRRLLRNRGHIAVLRRDAGDSRVLHSAGTYEQQESAANHEPPATRVAISLRRLFRISQADLSSAAERLSPAWKPGWSRSGRRSRRPRIESLEHSVATRTFEVPQGLVVLANRAERGSRRRRLHDDEPKLNRRLGVSEHRLQQLTQAADRLAGDRSAGDTDLSAAVKSQSDPVRERRFAWLDFSSSRSTTPRTSATASCHSRETPRLRISDSVMRTTR